MLALLLGLACGGSDGLYAFSDAFHPAQWALPDDDPAASILGPYAVGATFVVHAHLPKDAAGDGAIEMYSTDPDVLAIEEWAVEGPVLSARVTAVGEGDARLQVWRGERKELASTGASAYVIEDAYLVSAVGYLTGDPLVGREVLVPRIVDNGIGTFLLRYTSGDTLLYGGGIAEIVSDQAALFLRPETYMGIAGEWFQIAARPNLSADLLVNGAQISRVEPSVVPQSSVTSVEVIHSDEGGRALGELLFAGAVGWEEGVEAPVVGMSGTWSVDEEATEDVVAEAVAYRFSPGLDTTLSVVFQAEEGRAVVQGSYQPVDDEADPFATGGGCSALPTTVPAALLALVTILVGLRRR